MFIPIKNHLSSKNLIDENRVLFVGELTYYLALWRSLYSKPNLVLIKKAIFRTPNNNSCYKMNLTLITQAPFLVRTTL